MKYTISHTTTYRYAEAASLSHNDLCLTPRNTPSQQCLQHDIQLTPKPSAFSQRKDYFGNTVTSTTIESPHATLTVAAVSQVALTPNPMLSLEEKSLSWDHVKTELWNALTHPSDPETLMASQYLFSSPMIPLNDAFAAWATDLFPPGRPFLEAALALTERIYTAFTYDPQATATTTPVEAAFDIKRGVCQDFAHVEIACLRSLGLPARYVSGYLHTLPPPGKPKMVGADASHAWLAIYLPGTGWVDLDPTNNVIPAEQHITLAWGRDYSDVTPVKGTVLGGGQHQLNVAVDVAPC